MGQPDSLYINPDTAGTGMSAKINSVPAVTISTTGRVRIGAEDEWFTQENDAAMARAMRALIKYYGPSQSGD